MNTTELPRFSSDPARFILHATDFSPGSERAFAHALRLALANKAKLSLLHVGDDADGEWDRFPAVRQTLERWGFLEANSRRADVAKLGIGIEKCIIRTNNVAGAIAHHAMTRQTDMLVLATEQRHDFSRWIQPSMAEKAARKLDIPTLFVPGHGRGCVSLDDGAVTLDEVLIPVDHDPPASDAVERGLRAITMFGSEQSQLTLLHIGEESRFPNVRVPDGTWRVTRATRSGSAVGQILSVAEETAADLIIMVTKGSEGFLDALRGTTTEQVLRRAPCPVLSIPAAS